MSEVSDTPHRRPSVASAITWSMLGHAASRAISPLVFLVLAKLLTPEDYGIAAVATMVTSFCQLFVTAGVNRYLVQYENNDVDVNAVASEAFWLNLVVSFGFMALLLVFAPQLAAAMNVSEAAAVIRAQSLQIPLAALGAVQLALLQRSFQYRRIFIVNIVTSLIPGIISVALAVAGFGYWAIVWGAIASPGAASLWMWITEKWRPSLTIRSGQLGDLARFSSFSTAEAVLGWVFGWIDAILVGLYLTVDQLGVYRTGGNLVMLISALLVAPVLPVVYRSLALLQKSPDRMRELFLQTTQIMTTVSVATSLCLLLTFDLWPGFVFSSEWQGIEPVMLMFVIFYAFSGLGFATPSMLSARGRPDLPVYMNGVLLCLYIPVYVWALRIGFEAFLAARYLLGISSILLHVVVLDLKADIRPMQYFARVGRSLAVFVPAAVGAQLLGPDWVAAKLGILVASIGALLLLNRTALVQVVAQRPTRSEA